MGPIRGRPNAPASPKGPPRRLPPAPSALPAPLPSSPVTQSSRPGVCLRACELPKLIVMVCCPQSAGCFLACARRLAKEPGSLLGPTVDRMILWIRCAKHPPLPPPALRSISSSMRCTCVTLVPNSCRAGASQTLQILQKEGCVFT